MIEVHTAGTYPEFEEEFNLPEKQFTTPSKDGKMLTKYKEKGLLSSEQ